MLHEEVSLQGKEGAYEEMTDKIMFIPKTEQYSPQDLVIYVTVFNLGFFEIKFRIIKSELAGLTAEGIKHLREIKPDLAKDYINIMTIGQLGWIWLTTDDFKQAETNYKDIIKRLKEGDDVEFTDVSGANKPIKVSWRGLQFHW